MAWTRVARSVRVATLAPAVALLLLATVPALAAPAPAPAPAPDWFLAHVADKTAGGGRWLADNSAYRDGDGGIETFVLDWTAGPGATAMTGRLYGLRNGTETPTFWEFRVFWHPGEDRARVYQFGTDGAVGIGVLHAPDGDGMQLLEQTFFAADGSAQETRHATRVEPGREVGTNSALIDGEWVAQRTYTWIRQ